MTGMELIDSVVIGGGQAGLAAGYFLAQQGRDFVILDAQDRAGDSWRRRWDSLRLFTPPSFNNLPGLPYPGPQRHALSKEEMADYLESYAAQFKLPVQFEQRVHALARDGDRYLIDTNSRRFEANQVIVATGTYTTPRLPAFARELDPAIQQLHSGAYRHPSQLRDGGTLVVGAGNSGVEIALDLAPRQAVWLAGRNTGFIPADSGTLGYRVGTVLFHSLMQRLTVDTLPGRWLLKQARAFTGGHPVIGVRPEDLTRAGIERVPRVVGVSGGRPLLEGGRLMDVTNVVWATGFVRDFSWIRLPVFDATGEPIHHRGMVPSGPGLYFVGLPFQSSLLSGLVAGVGLDAEYIVRQIVARTRTATGRRWPFGRNGFTCRPSYARPAGQVDARSDEAGRLTGAH